MFASQFFCIIIIFFGTKWAFGDRCNLPKVDLLAYVDGYVGHVIPYEGDETSICVMSAEMNIVPWEASSYGTDCRTRFDGRGIWTNKCYHNRPVKLGDTAYFNITVTRGEQKCSSGLINVTVIELVPRDHILF